MGDKEKKEGETVIFEGSDEITIVPPGNKSNSQGCA